MPTGQASRGGKAVPDHMDKIVWVAAPQKGLVGANHFLPDPGRRPLGFLHSAKIARTRTCGDDDHVGSDLWGFGSESDDCADPAPNQIIECLVGRGLRILDRFFRLT
jgi:hypothetical protein